MDERVLHICTYTRKMRRRAHIDLSQRSDRSLQFCDVTRVKHLIQLYKTWNPLEHVITLHKYSDISCTLLRVFKCWANAKVIFWTVYRRARYRISCRPCASTDSSNNSVYLCVSRYSVIIYKKKSINKKISGNVTSTQVSVDV